MSHEKSKFSLFQKEKQFLIALSRTCIDQTLETYILTSVQSGLNWEKLYSLALSNGVLPLAFKSLNRCCAGLIPKDVLEKFKASARKTAITNLSMSSILLKLLTVLNQNNIIAVPFKGPLLAHSVYGNLSLRSFGDLDVLVNTFDVSQAYTLLTKTGYEPEIYLTNSQIIQFVKTEDNISFIHSQIGVIIELHWELSGNYLPRALTLDTVQPRIVKDDLLDHTVLTLGDEDLLIYLCIHGSKHIWHRLEWICCVNELITNNSKLNWTLVLQLANEWSAGRMLAIGLLLAVKLFNTIIPEEILHIVSKDKKANGMVSLIVGMYMEENSGNKVTYFGNRFAFWQFGCTETVRGKIRLVVAMSLFPTIEDWRRMPLPAQFSFFYWFFRPLRLIIEVIKRIFSRK